MDHSLQYLFFFFNDTATTEIYTLSLHDALPIFIHIAYAQEQEEGEREMATTIQSTECNILPEPGVDLAGCDLSLANLEAADRKSTRLNSSHANISYAVFCLKKKKTQHINISQPY